MVWPYVYGCNMHRGAEGDNSQRQFGTSRKAFRRQGPLTHKSKAVVKHTPASLHLAAMSAAQSWPATLAPNNESGVSCTVQRNCPDEHKAKFNANRSPELGVMYDLSKGKLPSRRLRFQCPDLFPEVMEPERPLQSRIYYQEPPRLVNTESLLKWMVPSVPWRYLRRHHYTSPTRIEEDIAQASAMAGAPGAEDGREKGAKEGQLCVEVGGLVMVDVGCQTASDVGTQTDCPGVLEENVEDSPPKKEVIVVRPLAPALLPTAAADKGGRPREMNPQLSIAIPKAGGGDERRQQVSRRRGRRQRRTRISKFGKQKRIAAPKLLEPSARSRLAGAPSLKCQQEESARPALSHWIPPDLGKGLEQQRSAERASERLEYEPKPSPPHPHVTKEACPTPNQHLGPDGPTPDVSSGQTSSTRVATSPERNGEDVIRRQQPPVDASRTKQAAGRRMSRPKSIKLKPRPLDAAEKPSSSEDHRKHPHREKSLTSNDDGPVSLGSSAESLEELERLIEEQHAQLVAKGFLPPDSKLEASAESTLSPCNTASPNPTPPEFTAGETAACFTDKKVSGATGSSPAESYSFDSSLYDTSLSRLMESLGMSTGEEAPSKDLTGESSEMERSAAAIAALTSYQSLLEDSLEDDVVYDVSISKESPNRSDCRTPSRRNELLSRD